MKQKTAYGIVLGVGGTVGVLVIPSIYTHRVINKYPFVIAFSGIIIGVGIGMMAWRITEGKWFPVTESSTD